jgi:methylamine dehydrogenase heavy chain
VVVLSLLGPLSPRATAADFVPEAPSTATVPAGPHQVWMHDIAGISYTKATLYDADTGRLLGSVDTGYLGMKLELSAKAARFFSVETYLSRGFRGERTDVVTIYDAKSLRPVGEIGIPAKRLLGMPTTAHSSLLDDERFLVAYNFSPASTVSVVDLERERFAGEIELAGCALLYPLGPRRFASLCGDGGLLELILDDEGHEQTRKIHPKLFDPNVDPLMEKAVRAGATWYFVSFAGDVHPVDASGAEVAFGATWPLASDAERAAKWLPGGLQPFAVHAPSGRLYALMHKGPRDTHKEHGETVWVFDLATKKRVQTISLAEPASSIALSSDATLLYAAFLGSPTLSIYDARGGKRVRQIAQAAAWPALLQPLAGGGAP